MARSITTPAFVLLFALLTILTTLTHALPTPQSAPTTPSKPFRFDVSSPQTDTLWLVDSLPTVHWDTVLMPEGSTMDIALLHHEKKESILLRRYVPTRLGSTQVNLRPEIVPGTYSLLLTVFQGRTSTVIGRSLVQSIILVEEESADSEAQMPLSSIVDIEQPVQEQGEVVEQQQKKIRKPETSDLTFKRKNQHAILEAESVELTHQPLRGNLVLRAPYTVGWSIPKALETARRARVNILLVSLKTQEVVRVLAANVDAKAGFLYVMLPEDTPLGNYQIKVEIIGKGRKFSGYTNQFHTSLPAFSSRA
ncbi:hypothetical protein BGZ97_007444 [Linnemannia gamsii]|uniref:Macroglobulin domain-containing protein n=1 Tax=Linnemannia gamsii TaxID=64522 RepID=A0A9P6RAE7_9FUNG|nr:hypothetical protein BGZ97_007444 [Linnemannia gamsii]